MTIPNKERVKDGGLMAMWMVTSRLYFLLNEEEEGGGLNWTCILGTF